MRDLGVITGWIAAAVDEPIPSAAMFDWWVRPRRLVQIGVSVVGVPRDETVLHVRRDKAAFSSGCKPRPATAPAGSNRGRHGGDEMSEAPG